MPSLPLGRATRESYDGTEMDWVVSPGGAIGAIGGAERAEYADDGPRGCSRRASS